MQRIKQTHSKFIPLSSLRIFCKLFGFKFPFSILHFAFFIHICSNYFEEKNFRHFHLAFRIKIHWTCSHFQCSTAGQSVRSQNICVHILACVTSLSVSPSGSRFAERILLVPNVIRQIVYVNICIQQHVTWPRSSSATLDTHTQIYNQKILCERENSVQCLDDFTS